MITYPGIKHGAFKDPDERQQAQTIDNMLRQISAALSRSVFPGTQPAANPVTPAPGVPAGLPTPTQGDLIYGLLTGAWTKLSIGADGAVLSSNGGTPSWTAASSLLTVHDHSNSANGGNIPEASVTSLVTDLAAKEVTANKNAANGYAGLNGSSKLTGSQQTYGSAANTACEGNDSRLADSRTPTSHGASLHTDRTRRTVIPIGSWESNTKTTSGTEPNAASVISMLTAAFTRTHVTFRVPADYASGAILNVYFAASGTDASPFSVNVYTKKLVSGTTSIVAAYDNLDAASANPTGTANIFVIGPATISTSLAAADAIRLTVERDGLADGNLNTMFFLGGDFEYTADM